MRLLACLFALPCSGMLACMHACLLAGWLSEVMRHGLYLTDVHRRLLLFVRACLVHCFFTLLNCLGSKKQRLLYLLTLQSKPKLLLFVSLPCRRQVSSCFASPRVGQHIRLGNIFSFKHTYYSDWTDYLAFVTFLARPRSCGPRFTCQLLRRLHREPLLCLRAMGRHHMEIRSLETRQKREQLP